MAEISAHTLVVAGTAPTFRAAASGDTAKTGADYFLVVRNVNAATRTVTIVVPGNTSYGVANPDKEYTVAANNGELWIPLLDEYRDPATGAAAISYSATTDVTVAVVRR